MTGEQTAGFGEELVEEQNHPTGCHITRHTVMTMATMSEIDDIFSSKAKPKQKKKQSSTFLPESKSASKKRPLPETVVDDLPGPSKHRKKDSIPKSSSKKPPLPETVVDTSADIPGPSKRRIKDSIPNKNSKPTKSKMSEPTDFADSRGSGDRRKTEEGWSVYKEAELGLNNEGGDTPSCPFDCNCCF